MGFFMRLFGICSTRMSDDQESWKLSDGVAEVRLDRIPELAQPGGAIRLERAGQEPRLLVVRGVDGEFHAFGNNCACSGWRIDPVAGEEKVRCCTLMASTYDYQGKRLSGPAKDDLKVYPVEVDGDRLIVRLS